MFICQSCSELRFHDIHVRKSCFTKARSQTKQTSSELLGEGSYSFLALLGSRNAVNAVELLAGHYFAGL